jgi:hypothetical protein
MRMACQDQTSFTCVIEVHEVVPKQFADGLAHSSVGHAQLQFNVTSLLVR